LYDSLYNTQKKAEKYMKEKETFRLEGIYGLKEFQIIVRLGVRVG
jgi:hypothetical protein